MTLLRGNKTVSTKSEKLSQRRRYKPVKLKENLQLVTTNVSHDVGMNSYHPFYINRFH